MESPSDVIQSLRAVQDCGNSSLPRLTTRHVSSNGSTCNPHSVSLPIEATYSPYDVPSEALSQSSLNVQRERRAPKDSLCDGDFVTKL